MAEEEPAIANSVVAENLVLHGFGDVWMGRVAFNEALSGFHTGFPDAEMAVEFTMSEGDKVAVRWRVTGTHSGASTGIGPAGRRIDIAGPDVYRVAGGRVAEMWAHPDMLGLLRRIGAVPLPPVPQWPGGAPSPGTTWPALASRSFTPASGTLSFPCFNVLRGRDCQVARATAPPASRRDGPQRTGN